MSNSNCSTGLQHLKPVHTVYGAICMAIRKLLMHWSRARNVNGRDRDICLPRPRRWQFFSGRDIGTSPDRLETETTTLLYATYLAKMLHMVRLQNKKCSEAGPKQRCSGLKQYKYLFRYYHYKDASVSKMIHTYFSSSYPCLTDQLHLADPKLHCQAVQQHPSNKRLTTSSLTGWPPHHSTFCKHICKYWKCIVTSLFQRLQSALESSQTA